MKVITLDLTKSVINLAVLEDCIIHGLFVGKKSDSITSNVIITCSKPGIKSRINIKSVLYDTASINLNCKIVIPKGIKNIDCYLDIKILNLSDQATVNVIPGLEILENDVKCGHSLIIGKPDKDQIKYLQSRGLSEKQAIDLIVQGFLQK